VTQVSNDCKGNIVSVKGSGARASAENFQDGPTKKNEDITLSFFQKGANGKKTEK